MASETDPFPVDIVKVGSIPRIDPTANVIALVEANAKAQAELRVADSKFNDAQTTHIKDIGDLRAKHAETLRVSDLEGLAKTRQVDVLAGAASAAALATAVQTLANTSDRNAETLRNLVNATAQTTAKETADRAAVLSAQTDSLLKDINARIAELQKSTYQGVGKSSVSDPASERLAQSVEKLIAANALGSGEKKGGKDTVNWIFATIAAIAVIFGLWKSSQTAQPIYITPQATQAAPR